MWIQCIMFVFLGLHPSISSLPAQVPYYVATSDNKSIAGGDGYEDERIITLTESVTNDELFNVVVPASYQDPRGILYSDRLNVLVVPDATEVSRAAQELSSIPDRQAGMPLMDTAAVVQINTDVLFSQAKEFYFRVPWENKTLLARRKQIEIQSSEDWKYYGEVIDPSAEANSDGLRDQYGYLLLLRENGKDFGSLVTDGGTFRIEPFNEPHVSLLLLDNRNRNNRICGHDDHEQLVPADHNELKLSEKLQLRRLAALQPTNVVDVLVLFTAAAAEVWDPEVSAARSIAETQAALINSDVLPADLTINHVGTELLAEFVESSRDADLDRFPTFGNAEQLREDAAADIVILLVDEGYLEDNIISEGSVTSSQPGDPTIPEANLGCGIVSITSPGERQTFTHEVGHLFGGQHQGIDITGFVNVADFAFGHLYFTGRWAFARRRATLMRGGGGLPNRGRELRFSNPDVDHRGEPTGVTAASEMDEQLRNQTGLVSCYQISVPPFMASINGPWVLDPNTSGTFSANSQNCPGSVSYTWHRSDDFGAFYFVGSGSSVTINAGNNGYVNLRLTATCAATGEQSTVFHFIEVEGGASPCGQGIPCFDLPSNEDQSLVTSGGNVFGIHIDKDIETLKNDDADSYILISDYATGRVLKRMTPMAYSNFDLRSLRTSSLMVIISIVSEQGVSSHPVIIN